MRKREERALPPHFSPSPVFKMVSFVVFVAELLEGSSDASRLPSWVLAAWGGGGLAGSGSMLAGVSKSLHLSEQSEEAWDRRTLGAAI